MSDWTWTLAEILLNAAWIGAVAYLAALAFERLPGAGPALKATTGLAALAAAVLLPVLQQAEWPQLAPPPHVAVEAGAGLPAFAPSPISVPGPAAGRWTLPAGPIAEALVRAWLLGALIGLSYLLFGVATALRIKMLARRSSGDWAGRERRWTTFSTPRARLLVSEDLASPVAVGWLRPAVLFPPALADSLSEDELERLWLHEAAHLERYDDWLVLLERACVAILWFHPAAWALARRVAVEREMACDALAADRAGSRTDYARTLTRLAELRLARGVAPALSIAGDNNLSRRIEMLLEDRPRGAGRLGQAGLGLTLTACASAVAAILIAGPLVGLAQTAPPAPPAPLAAAAPAAPAVPSAPAAAPAPKPAPAPQPKPMPTPQAKPVPPVPPVPPIDAETQAEIRALSEEMRAMGQELQAQIEADLKPHQAEMQALAEEMRTKHEPFAQKMRELAKEMAELQVQRPMTADQERALEEKGRLMEQQAKSLEAQTKGIEAKMRALEAKMKPNQEKIEAIEKRMRERAAELEKRIQERMQSNRKTP